MNLRKLANAATRAINPNIPATIRHSAGSTTSRDGRRVPTYSDPVEMMAQVQALTTKDLMQLDGLNIQGSTHKIYLNDPINGVVRSTQKGGDTITLHSERHGEQTYLVTAVLEQWPSWTAAAVTLQLP